MAASAIKDNDGYVTVIVAGYELLFWQDINVPAAEEEFPRSMEVIAFYADGAQDYVNRNDAEDPIKWYPRNDAPSDVAASALIQGF